MIKNLKDNILEIFSSKKSVNSKILNILGLQILRYILAKITYHLSDYFIKKKSEEIKNYESKGYALIENFLTNEDYLKVKNEFEKIFDEKKIARNVYENKSENNSSIDYFLYEFEDNEFNKKNFYNLYKVFKSEKIINIFKSAERKNNITLFMRLERIITKNDLKNDVNSYWHVDTYHNTHKAWIYLDDIKKENGPFNYIVGSNRFSFQRLVWEYVNSIKISFYKNFLAFFLDEKKSKKFEKKKIEIICNQNSFMIANTHGYHRRGDASINKVRNGISFFTRENPFKLI